ncbi:MAG: TIGR02281 family clan AA aspartic protease [Proteobacteria bacterium]|nr:TIGR02281 family clan AA aspartic protease [Pseudomonadota bacterium]
MTALAWISLMVFVGFYFEDMLSKQHNPNQSLETQYTEARVREVALQRNKYGHYVTSGKVNGQPVVFMLDTGATGVAIPDHIARKLSIKRGRPLQVQTANGTATSYSARLESVSVGDIVLHDVRAGISPGFKGDEILLGMSFLKHIEFTQRGDTLILKQYF